MKTLMWQFYINVFLLIILTSTASAQKDSTTKYYCTFTDTITISIPQEVYQNAASDMSQNMKLSDSLKQKLNLQIWLSSLRNSPMQIQTRKVEASIDSTLVIMSSDIIHKGLKTSLPYKKMIIEKGRKITSVVGLEDNLLEIPSNLMRTFSPTGGSKTILGFECIEYSAEEGSILIWVTNELPSSINPGISNVNIPGAILGFQMRKKSQILSTLTGINKY